MLTYYLIVFLNVEIIKSREIAITSDVGIVPERVKEFDTKVDFYCNPKSSCVPKKFCPLLDDLMDPSCISSNNHFRRSNSLSCTPVVGSKEVHVCCPPDGYKTLHRHGFSPEPSTEFETQCGNRVIHDSIGTSDGMGAHPWVARIAILNKDNGRLRYICGGSIISERVILTAAHCALTRVNNYNVSNAVVGEWDTEVDAACNELFCKKATQSIAIKHVIVYPGYKKEVFLHDIALLVLQDDISYTATSAPICLSDSPQETEIMSRATLVGWGELSGQTSQPPQQQQLEVPLQPLYLCAAVFAEHIPPDAGQMCAGGDAGKDPCVGFGGSPLIIKVKDRFTQIGIFLFGADTCDPRPGMPNYYTKISHYTQWIRENLQT